MIAPLHQIDPDAVVSRKSGSWSVYHCDSALVKRDGHSYIAVALRQGTHGSEWLGRIITVLDSVIVRDGSVAVGRPVVGNRQIR